MPPRPDSPPLPIWQRLSLSARVVLIAGIALVIGSLSLLTLLVRDEAGTTRTQLVRQSALTLDAMEAAVAEQVVVGDYATIEQMLIRHARTTDVVWISFDDRHGPALVAEGPPPSAAVPPWFMRVFKVPDQTATREIRIGGQHYGNLAIRLSPRAAFHHLWLRVQWFTAMIVIWGGITFLFLAATIRAGFSPLRPLSEAARRLARGRFGGALPVAGPPELRETIGAFNRMGQDIEQLLGNLHDEKELAQVTLRSIGDGVITTDGTGHVTLLNSVAESLTGWQNDAARGRPVAEVFRMLQQVTHQPVAEDPVSRCLRLGALVGESGGIVIERHGDAREFVIEESAAPIRDTRGAIVGAVLVFRDVSEKQALNDRLAWQARHDPLTSLGNRPSAEEAIAREIARARRTGVEFTLLFIDLDHFKEVNDSLGHEAGDAVLREVARRIVHVVRAENEVSRLGGDEFLVLLPQTSVDGAAELAGRVIKSLSEPIAWGDRALPIGASIGISHYPHDGDSTRDLLRAADAAMYEAKARGRAGYAIFARDLSERVEKRLQLREDLQRALAAREFVMHYQPIVRLADSTITSVEALVRWQDPQLGLRMPGEFIPYAEETGLITPITDQILDSVAHDIAAWRAEGITLPVSVNISAITLSDTDLPGRIIGVLARHGVGPDWLTLEITESAAARDFSRSLSLLTECRRLGLHVSIDDFGTGYSSLSYLKRLPAHSVKIDRSFIDGLSHDPDDEMIVRAVLALCESLGRVSVAEGIETRDQYLKLLELGCVCGQGFWLARPMPREELLGFVRNSADFKARATAQMDLPLVG